MQEQFHFSIGEPIDPKNSYLAMQVAQKFFSYSIYNPGDNRLLQLKYFSFQHISPKMLDTIIAENKVLEGNFNKIITSLDFGFNTLLPAEMSQTETSPLLYLENADQQDHAITEVIAEKGIANIYTVPSNILTWMVHNFPSSGYLHTQSVGIKSAPEDFENGWIRVDVQAQKCAVIVSKGAQLLLSKDYNYSSPADVVFYLLKICEVFALAQDTVSIVLSGLLDTNSKLYRELYDYFLNISLKQTDWNDVITGLPKHYFTSLNALTICELLQEA